MSSPRSSVSGPGGPVVGGPLDFSALNVREIFETRSVDETKDLHRKINNEIERKREDLRMLVGERYRDLIEAADTIGTMRHSSSDIYKKLINLRKNINLLPSQVHLTSQKTFNLTDTESRINSKELELCAELKVSLELPRKIQNCLESSNLIEALHLSLLYSRKLNRAQKPYKWTFLSDSDRNGEIDQAKEIENSILRYCDEHMNDFSISPEKLAECICTKQILTSQSCELIIKEIFSKKVQLYQDILEESSEEEIALQITQPIFAIYEIFLGSQQIYTLTLKELRRPNKITNFEQFHVNFLPKFISDFNMEPIVVDDPPRISRLAEIIKKNFMSPLKLLLEDSFSEGKFLKKQKTLEEMQNFRLNTCAIFRLKTEELMRIVLGPSGRSFWTEVCAQVFQLKCENVIENEIQSIYNYLINDSYSKARGFDVNFDLVGFVWRNKPNNFQLENEFEEELKLKCISPNLANFCTELNTKFELLLRDFQTLSESSSLREFQSSQLVQLFEKFYASLPKKDLFLGRFSSALGSGEFCPSLWKLLEKNDLAKLRQFFLLECEECWSTWAAEIKEKFHQNLESSLPLPTALNLIKTIPVAEEFTSNSNDSNNETNTNQEPTTTTTDSSLIEDKLRASVRVPLQISHFLHRALFDLCLEIASKGYNSIPKNVSQSLRFDVGQVILQFYQDKLISQVVSHVNSNGNGDFDREKEKLTSQLALQFIMDLKFVLWFHPGLGKIIDEPLKVLQSLVDPFDLDIVSNKTASNLKRFLFENHLTLGLLFSEESQVFIAQSFKTKQSQNFPSSNENVLSKNLPLLPI